MIFIAASDIIVPGPKIPATPFEYKKLWSFSGIIPPVITFIFSFFSFFNILIISGTSVLWAPPSEDIPITCTSFSIACLTTSCGVWNKAPKSTSNPTSEKPVAIIFEPLSCPSCPTFAINILGLLPSLCSKLKTCFFSYGTQWPDKRSCLN